MVITIPVPKPAHWARSALMSKPSTPNKGENDKITPLSPENCTSTTIKYAPCIYIQGGSEKNEQIKKIINKSYKILPMRFDLSVKLKCQPRIIILSLGFKYAMRDLICDVIIVRETQNCDMRHITLIMWAFILLSSRYLKLWIPILNHFRWKFVQNFHLFPYVIFNSITILSHTFVLSISQLQTHTVYAVTN